MAARPIRYAVVGLGNIARSAVLPAFSRAAENSELVALVSSDPDKRASLAQRYGVATTGGYDELERVVADARVDAVYLAVPNTLHRPLTERAARAGAHVICEKPMALTAPDCEAMIAAAEQSRVRLMVAYRLHFEPSHLRLLARVHGGEIGEARLFSSVFCHQVRAGDVRTRSELGGGALFDLGVYCVHAARALFRDEPVEVLGAQAFGAAPGARDVDESTTAILRFPGGRIAQFVASQGAADVSSLRVVGSKGDVRLERAYDYAREQKETVTVAGEVATTHYPGHDQFAPELVHFSGCILEGREPGPSARQGLADVRVLEAIARSARLGSSVALDPAQSSARSSTN